MLKNFNEPSDLQRLLLSLLATSGTLAGLSLTLVGIVDLKVSGSQIESVADDMFLFAALGFVLVCYLIFFTLRRLQSARLRWWTAAIDVVFLGSLTLLLMAGFAVVYYF
jgi:hypothetical protein